MRVKAFRLVKVMFVVTLLTTLPIACNRKADENKETPVAKNAEVRDYALVRFVNATAYSEPVDVYVDEMKVIPAVGKDKATDYNDWEAKRHEIAVRVANADKPAATNSEGLSAGKHYTVIAFSKADGTPAVSVFTDKEPEPGSGKAKIRLIHVADGADELGVFLAGAKDSLVNGVNYNTDSVVDVDPSVRSLEIRKEGEKVVALNIPELSLEPGKTTTIVVASDQDRKLRAIKLDDSLPAQGLNR
jgi:hypothetical protein